MFKIFYSQKLRKDLKPETRKPTKAKTIMTGILPKVLLLLLMLYKVRYRVKTMSVPPIAKSNGPTTPFAIMVPNLLIV